MAPQGKPGPIQGQREAMERALPLVTPTLCTLSGDTTRSFPRPRPLLLPYQSASLLSPLLPPSPTVVRRRLAFPLAPETRSSQGPFWAAGHDSTGAGLYTQDGTYRTGLTRPAVQQSASKPASQQASPSQPASKPASHASQPTTGGQQGEPPFLDMTCTYIYIFRMQ